MQNKNKTLSSSWLGKLSIKGFDFLLFIKFFLSFTKIQTDLECSEKDKMTAGSTARALQLHLAGVFPESCRGYSRKQASNAVTYRSLESERSQAAVP